MTAPAMVSNLFPRKTRSGTTVHITPTGDRDRWTVSFVRSGETEKRKLATGTRAMCETVAESHADVMGGWE